MRIRYAAALVLAVSVLSAADAEARKQTAQSSTHHGTIAFVRSSFEEARGRLMFAGAGGVVGSTKTAFDTLPVWSPSGDRIAFYAPGPGARLYVTDRRGGHRSPITPKRGYACYWLNWSPTGSGIAYTVNDGCEGGLSVRVVGPGGRGDRRLVPGRTFDPVWSPRGRRILYSSFAGGEDRVRLFVADPRGRHRHAVGRTFLRHITGVPIRPQAAWSPSGRRIYFIGEDEGLWVMRADGSHVRELAPQLEVFNFELSPNGRQLALEGLVTPGTRDIYVLGANGGGLRRLTSGQGVQNQDPRWSPNGRWLAFVRRERYGGQADIYVMDTNAKHLERVTRSPEGDIAPAWRPGS